MEDEGAQKLPGFFLNLDNSEPHGHRAVRMVHQAPSGDKTHGLQQVVQDSNEFGKGKGIK